MADFQQHRRMAAGCRLGTWFAAICLLGAGCTPVLLYKGPARDPDRVARISARTGTRIVAVDGTPVRGPGLAVYEIEAGTHEMVVSMKDDGSLSPALRKSNATSPPICIDLREGHSYEVSVLLRGERLRRSVYDLVTGCEIGTLSVRDFEDDADPNIDKPELRIDNKPGYESQSDLNSLGVRDEGLEEHQGDEPTAWDRRTWR